MTGAEEDFSPERVRWYLEHWDQLASSAEGGTGSLAGHGAGRGDRLTLACLIADLEAAADKLPLDWRATAEVYKLQHRGRIWVQRRLQLDDRHSVDSAIAAMARSLGWKG